MAAGVISLLLLFACTSPPARPEATDTPGVAVSLVHTDFTALELPGSSRSQPPEHLPIGPWELAQSTDTHKVWVATTPLRTRAMFTHKPQQGMTMHTPDGKLFPHSKRVRGKGDRFWTWTRDKVKVRLPPDQKPDGLYMVYDRATMRSRAINRKWWCEDEGIEDCDNPSAKADFARTEVLIGSDMHSGLFLPAPATATWSVTIPPAAELHLAPTLVEPEVRDGRSDGATLVAELTVDGSTNEVYRQAIGEETRRDRVNLAAWSGKTGELTLRVEPGASADYDYVFLEEPAITSRKKNPRRVVLVFVDTVRPDHLGLYGYERDTSPWLDAFAEDGAVFENARSVAPWTLPTTRTMITGRQPEYFDTTRTLPDRFSEHGWATAMIAGNVFVGANFGIARGWGTHHDATFPGANQQVDKAIDYLARNDGRDALLLLHFMDAHLPYHEPSSHRRKFAGDAVAPMGEKFHRGGVPNKVTDEQRQYIIDRYDNNIRWVDDNLRRLAETLDEDDVVMYLADHGEEFWEHGGYEHGHTLFDEVIRVPMVLRAPGITGTRVEEPVSMLDVTPTLLEAAGIEADGLDGRSLVPLGRQEPDAKSFFATRDQAFGRPLYGFSRWGVLDVETGNKYTTHEGRESLYDLSADPGETKNLLAGKTGGDALVWRDLTTEALGRDTAMGYRIEINRGTALTTDMVVEVEVPGGVRSAWQGWDPMRRSTAHVDVEGDVFRATFQKGTSGSREVFFAPVAPLAELTHALEFHIRKGRDETILCIPEKQAAEPGALRSNLASTTFHRRRFVITWGVFPDAAGGDAGGMDDENKAELEALGYIEEDAGGEGGDEPIVLEPCGNKAKGGD